MGGQFLDFGGVGTARVQHGSPAPGDRASVLTVQLHDIMRPAGRVIEVQMRECLPTSTESEDLNAILAAAVGGALDDRVEAGNVAATSKYADALYRHSSKTIASSAPQLFRLVTRNGAARR